MLNLDQLEAELETLPQQIETQELEVIKMKKLVEEKKLEYDVAFGMALTSSSAPNATEKKSYATIQTKDSYLALIEAKYNHEKALASLNYRMNRFTSLRKIGSLRTEMMKSQLGGN